MATKFVLSAKSGGIGPTSELVLATKKRSESGKSGGRDPPMELSSTSNTSRFKALITLVGMVPWRLFWLRLITSNRSPSNNCSGMLSWKLLSCKNSSNSRLSVPNVVGIEFERLMLPLKSSLASCGSELSSLGKRPLRLFSAVIEQAFDSRRKRLHKSGSHA